MKLKIANKIIAMCIIFTFIFSFSNPLFGKLIISEEDGIAYDLFDDANNVILENCTVENGTITLVEQSYLLEYDHSKKPDNIDAFENPEPFYVPGGDFGKILATLTNPALFGIYEFTDYEKINRKDNNSYETLSTADFVVNYVYHPLHVFKIQIDEQVEQLKQENKDFNIEWWYGGYNPEANLDEIRMYLWSYGDLLPRWNYIDNLNYTSENVNPPYGFISSKEKISKYVSDEGLIHILIVGKPKEEITPLAPAILSTDYIKVEIPINNGFKTQGHAILEPKINPDDENFKGWDKIIWDSSIPTDDTYIKIQVLNGTTNQPLSDNQLDGNIDGFLTSPVDLSSLGTDIDSIRIKAIFHTDLFSVTPRLFSWGVLWKTTDGFYDSFSSDFRIDEGFGIKIEDSNIKIDEFYTDWSIFGKSPENTRSYIGPNDYKLNQTYWQTDVLENIGGWFKSPIMSDGKIFIPGNETKIFAFNLTYDSKYGKTTAFQPSDVSTGGSYRVDNSLAVEDGHLIAATSALNSPTNAIYALNTSDLSDVLWRYPPNLGVFSNTICFSAAPTISDGKVYVTSWSGNFANQTTLNYLYSRVDNLFSNLLGVNNKLFILDLKSGYELLDPIRLPAASLSTPAVDDGMVYVGCENINGPSLFAIDETTGETVWNATVGTIGRASPIVVDTEEGKILIVPVREQSLLSISGTDKVIALNAETGDMLWNFTIGNETTMFRRNWLKTYEFHHIKAVEPPAATPAYANGLVFVMASDGVVHAIDVLTGKEKWNFATYSGVITEYHSISPIVVNNIVYVISQNAILYGLNIDNGEILVEHQIFYEGNINIRPFIYASPILTDGLLTVSIIDERLFPETVHVGHIITLGELKKNLHGRLYSSPIKIGEGKWWDKFNADFDNTTDNIVTFSILDGTGNILVSGLNGSNNDISKSDEINSNVIQLCAELEILNESGASPILNDWQVTWKDQTTAPQFLESTFKPALNGWIMNNTPVCSIKVQDLEPGLNQDEAFYRLTYVSNDKSKWFEADCSGERGSRSSETLTADLSKLSSIPDDIKRIEFRIDDLSGNTATFMLGNDFRIDQVPPTSTISNEIPLINNIPVDITVDANDPIEGNQSGIDSIGIYYRKVGETDWNLYDTAKNLFVWKFSPTFSGDFEVCTIAQDVAGNREEFPNTADAAFIYDATPPEFPEFDQYVFNWIPEINIEFEDDYILKTVEYRAGFSANWTMVNSEDINAKTYNATIILSEEWDKLVDDTTYNLFFRLTDFAGNQNTTLPQATLKFLIDTIPPGVEVKLDLSDFNDIGQENYKISATIPDNEQIANVTLHYSYSADGSDFGPFKQYGEDLTEGPYEWEFTTEKGSGYYKFYVKVWDAAGNYNISPEKEVKLTEVPYISFIVLILLFIVLIIVSFTILKKLKVIKG